MDVEFTKQLELNKHPVRISVVGHTNHGKTSTIRTLVEDAHIGTVDEAPDTTTKVEGFRVSHRGFDRFSVFDTPGFTNLDVRLAEFEAETGSKATSLEKMIDFMIGKESTPDKWIYKTLRQIERSHIIILVLDSREEVTNQSYLDEIDFLRTCGVPLIVSLNFVHRSDSNKQAWKKALLSKAVQNIIEFDAHTRTWQDEYHLFTCIRPLLCDPDHAQLHRDFVDFWCELRKQASREASLGAASDIAQTLVQLTNHVTRVRGVTKSNKSEMTARAELEFQRDVMKIFDDGADKVFKRYGFSWADAKKFQESVEGQSTASTFRFFDHSRLKWAAAGTVLVTGATIEALAAGVTFGIPSMLAATATYLTVSAYQVNREGDGTAISIRSTSTMLNQIAIAMVTVARTLRSRGKANAKMIEVHMDKTVFGKNPELVSGLSELFNNRKIDVAKLESLIHKAIVQD